MTKKLLGKLGRSDAPVDWEEFDKLCALQCPLSEIAGWYMVSEETIRRRVKEERSMTFEEYYALKRGHGKIALRRAQFNMALKNPTMAIWLGKNWLEQTDKWESKSHTTVDPQISMLLKDTIQELIALKKSK